MRSLRVPALVAGVACLSAAVAIVTFGARSNAQAAETVDQQVNYASRTAENALTQTFERIRTIDLILSREPSFRQFVADPRPRAVKLADQGGAAADIAAALRYVDTQLPGQLDSASFATLDGQEVARFANSRIALPGSLSNIKDALYFQPAITLGAGKVFRSAPYPSPSSELWVVTDSTVVVDGSRPVGVLSISVTMDSLRTTVISAAQSGQTLRVVDPGSGLVQMDSRVPTEALATASPEHPVMADDADFYGREDMFSARSGTAILGSQHMSFATLSTDLESGIDAWVVVASAHVDTPGVPLYVWLLFALGIGLIVLGVVLSILLVRERRRSARAAVAERDRLSGQLSDMSDTLSRVAAGDLGARLPVEGFSDENLATLVGAFDQTLVRVRELVAQAQASGDSVSRSAAELRVLAGQQADSAGEQSAAVTETTVTIQQLAATASQIAESAGGVAMVAGEMLILTENGRTAVNDSVGAMERIADRVGSITTSTTSLGEKVGEIGGILALLDDLSDQTNLLALNAAIEAARAGEHGRGFAVVAGEVRKLAERARESTGRIQSLVAEIQRVMTATLQASAQGAAEVEVGSGMAADAVGVLDQIANRVEEAATAVKEISVATQQQRSASDQVVVVMTRLSEVSNEYAAGSRQAAASADELAALADTMSSSIDMFTVSESDLDGRTGGREAGGSAVGVLTHESGGSDHPGQGWDDEWDGSDDESWDGTVMAVAHEFAALGGSDLGGSDLDDFDDEFDDPWDAPSDPPSDPAGAQAQAELTEAEAVDAGAVDTQAVHTEAVHTEVDAEVEPETSAELSG